MDDLNITMEVIEVWLRVQRQWMYLESIFNGSEDIRQQLNEEAKKFDKINGNYRKIMEDTVKDKNVLNCCVRSENGQRKTNLKNIQNELEKCQKSLTNYLDTKKNSFPRFYFVSNDDLLDILGSSKATTIQSHLLKLFDNVKSLKFENRDKQIVGMKSDEGEEFNFE